MPPANDNFANAIALNPSGGTGWFNNIGATKETGEPASLGATVWFSLTVSDPLGRGGQLFFFDTRQPDAIPPGNTPYLNTILQAFTGGSVNALTEMSYLLDGKQAFPAGGLCLGSYIIVGPLGAQTFYIRVDGVPNGWFFLKWGSSNGLPNIAKCGSCTDTLGIKVQCVATFQGPDLTTGDIHGTVMHPGPSVVAVWSVKRQNVTAPAGTYMLRYCSGYYYQWGNPTGTDFLYFTMVPSMTAIPDTGIQTFPTQAYLFLDNAASGLTLTPTLNPSAPPATVGLPAGLFNVVNSASYFDGTHWNSVNYNAGLLASQYNTAALLALNLNCGNFVFNHTGGKINWVFIVPLYVSPFYEGSGYPDTPLQTGVSVIGTPADGNDWFPTNFDGGPPVLFVGPSGVPTYDLMQILPDISLFAVANIWLGASPTANGIKNTQLNVTWKNNSTLVGWGPIRITETGAWFAVEDPAYYPSPPYITNIPSGGNFGYQVEWAMNANGNIGSVTLALSDSVPNPYPGPFTINVSPLFGNPTARAAGKINPNGVESEGIILGITNVGNGTTISLNFTITATVNGLPIQICGYFDNPTAFGPSVAYSPATNNSDPINPSGKGLGIDPNAAVTIHVAVPLISQPQNVVINLAVSDGTNALPPVQVSVTVPAA